MQNPGAWDKHTHRHRTQVPHMHACVHSHTHTHKYLEHMGTREGGPPLAHPHPPLQVNNNGVVSFGVSVAQYTPDPFPLADGRPFVAPYWGDVDTRLGGHVYYRQSRDATLLRRLTRDLRAYFPGIHFTATWALVATWDHVAFFGAATTVARKVLGGRGGGTRAQSGRQGEQGGAHTQSPGIQDMCAHMHTSMQTCMH